MPQTLSSFTFNRCTKIYIFISYHKNTNVQTRSIPWDEKCQRFVLKAYWYYWYSIKKFIQIIMLRNYDPTYTVIFFYRFFFLMRNRFHLSSLLLRSAKTAERNCQILHYKFYKDLFSFLSIPPPPPKRQSWTFLFYFKSYSISYKCNRV